MENKVLVELYVSATRESYDVYIPVDAYMHEVKTVLNKLLFDLSKGSFATDGSTLICDYYSGEIYNVNKFIKDLNIKNGSKLMVI